MYNNRMTDTDKFNSDLDRLLSRAAAPGAMTPGALAREMSRLFQINARDFGNLGEALSDYWTERYGPSLAQPEMRKPAADWLVHVYCLLSGCFEPAMDFPDDDWESIREIVSAEADDLDIQVLTEILTVIVDRGKA